MVNWRLKADFLLVYQLIAQFVFDVYFKIYCEFNYNTLLSFSIHLHLILVAIDSGSLRIV